MGLAEVLLRLGSTFVAWLLIYTQLIWLGTLRVVGCGSDADQFWWVLLCMAPLTALVAPVVSASQKLTALNATTRWFGAPLLILVPLALIPVAQALRANTLGAESICSVVPTPVWHPWWAPVQLLLLGWLVWQAWRAFKGGESGQTKGL